MNEIESAFCQRAWTFGIGGDISGIAHFPWIDLPKIFINADYFLTFSRRWVTIATV